MPKRGILKINEEINDEEFIKENRQIGKSKLYSKIVENNFNNAVELMNSSTIQPTTMEAEKKWKPRLDRLVKLQINKFDKEISIL